MKKLFTESKNMHQNVLAYHFFVASGKKNSIEMMRESAKRIKRIKEIRVRIGGGKMQCNMSNKKLLSAK